jgi:hypothetical protein
MIVAQHEVLGRIFKSDTSRTGRSMAHADQSIAMPLCTMKKFYRPFPGRGAFSLHSRHSSAGLLSVGTAFLAYSRGSGDITARPPDPCRYNLQYFRIFARNCRPVSDCGLSKI